MAGVPYPGNVPSNVARAAKYRVRGQDDARIELELELDHRTRAILTTQVHPHLADMVNRVKVDKNGQPNGSFYINEYGHVIVPDVTGTSWCAGRYSTYLEFDLDGGEVIGPTAPSGMQPGDPWRGPRVGVDYTASVDDDVYYKRQDGRIEHKHCLSDFVGQGLARQVSQMVKAVKGGSAGGFYINEAWELFAPVCEDGEWTYLYAGRAPEDGWFPEPPVPAGQA